MSEIILAFGLITMFTMITNGMVIYKQDNLMTLDKMGIEIGKRCPEQVLEYLNGKKFNLSEISGKIIFVEEDCVTCQVLVETINVSGRKDDDMITILVGKKRMRCVLCKNIQRGIKFLFLKGRNYIRC